METNEFYRDVPTAKGNAHFSASITNYDIVGTACGRYKGTPK